MRFGIRFFIVILAVLVVTPPGWTQFGAMAIAVDVRGNVYALDARKRQLTVLSGSGHALGKWKVSTQEALAPEAIAVTRAGHVLVSGDSAGSPGYVLEYTSSGRLLARLGRRRPPITVLAMATGIGDRIYLADGARNGIEVLSPTGRFLLEIGGFDARREWFGRIAGLAVDATNRVFTLDASAARVRVFSPSGKLLESWRVQPSHGLALREPRAITVDARGRVYVLAHSRVLQFNARGKFLSSWEVPNTWLDHNPQGLAADANGFVYVAVAAESIDSAALSVHKYNGYGKLLAQWKVQ